MSIWNDCDKYKAVPFFGFPLIPNFENDVLTFEFPKGYAPHRDKTKELANKMKEEFNGEILEVNPNLIKIKIDKNMLKYILYEHCLNKRM